MSDTTDTKLKASQLRAILRHGGIEELSRLQCLSKEQQEAVANAAEDIAAEDAKATAIPGFEDFLRAEYNNIAQAHFQTHTSITRFFEFYLIVVGLPITLFGVIAKCVGDSTGTVGAQPAASSIQASSTYDRIVQIIGSPYGWIILVLSGVIAFVGLCMMAYIVNLRLDAMLYARAVNGIRKYFFDRVRLDVREQMAMRALPRSIHQPRYSEWPFFGWVVAAFTCLDSLYAIVVYLVIAAWCSIHGTWFWVILGVVFLLSAATHAMVYGRLVRYREWRYLKSRIIGVDIDGVLSDHEPKFCEILSRSCNKQLAPEQITKIPVHELNVGVTRDDEQRVFNDPEYWVSLKAISGSANRLNELREVFGYKVYIFTHRDWPNPMTFPKEPAVKKDLKRRWRKVVWFATANLPGTKWLRRRAMRQVTEHWLAKHGIKYDRLIIERGNVHMSDPAIVTDNRFVIAQKKQMRIFVEDDLAKAVKLAGICDIVFLLSHRYNDVEERALPPNVIRLASWDEIVRFIRDNL